MTLKKRFERYTNWEHWPTLAFYLPLIPFFIKESLKARSLTYHLTTNPCMLYSGNGSESKYKTIAMIPRQYKPNTILIKQHCDFNTVLKLVKEKNIDFPMVAKPDIGFRGYFVQKIHSEIELKQYLKKIPVDFLIQEYIDLPNELGIFYHKIPHAEQGEITSITLKNYASVIGDGKSTIKELILNDDRIHLYLDLFKSIQGKNLDNILALNKKKTLSFIGNHSKGTQFVNGNHLISDNLVLFLDNFQKKLPHWYYGRIDLKFNSFKELEKGKNFKILEINGIISEPTHIYDTASGATYWEALKTIKNHWKIIGNIARINHQKNNIPYPKVIPYLNNMLALRKHAKILKKSVKN